MSPESMVEAPVGAPVGEVVADEPLPMLSPSVAPLVQPSLDDDDDAHEALVIDMDPIVIWPAELLALSRPGSSPHATSARAKTKGPKHTVEERDFDIFTPYHSARFRTHLDLYAGWSALQTLLAMTSRGFAGTGSARGCRSSLGRGHAPRMPAGARRAAAPDP